MRTGLMTLALCFLVALSFGVTPALAQSAATGRLKVHVSPKQAYVFVDGKAIRDGSQTIQVAAGDHEVGVYNYGYLPNIQHVHVGAGETTDLDVSLQSKGGLVSGPFAAIELKGDPRAAVLLNGQTPAYFVGHVDEFDWNWIWHQRLLVKPGTYQVTATREGNTLWSGPVTAQAGQRVIVYLDRNGLKKTREWKEGLTMSPQPRFKVGIASATIPIAPVTAMFAAEPSGLNCGQASALKWSAPDAVQTSISEIGSVPAQGDRMVQPSRDTTYVLTAKGPGGEATQSVKVNINPQPTVSLMLAQPEVHFHKIGDKVVQDDSTTLNWSATNADKVTITSLGSEAMKGSQMFVAKPKRTSVGAVNEDQTFTLTATNACGGTATTSATLRIVGSIDSPSATLASVFYPTAYPTRRHPHVGLVKSERMTLDAAATQFKDFEKYEHGANLVVVGYADVRGSRKYNKALSERRAALVRGYLVSRGVPAGDISIRAEGKEKQLGRKAVEAQLVEHPNADRWMKKSETTSWLAYNRRADLVLEPTGQQSALAYPDSQSDRRIVWQRQEPPLKRIELASKLRPSSEQARLSGLGK